MIKAPSPVMIGDANTAKKNLIIGVIKGYEYGALNKFVNSIKNTKFTGDVVLLTSSVSDETISELERRGIKTCAFQYRVNSGSMNSWSRFWPKIRPLKSMIPFKIMRFIMMRIFHLMDVRHFHMRDFLERNKDKYGLVLMTDVRDVVFQTDPFEIPLGGDVEFFEESSIVKIKDCSFNSGAIRERFGSEILQECQDQPIHCFGTVRGSIGGILSFLKMYEVYCMEAIQYATGTADQGILNVMINKFSSSFDFVTVPNLTGAVATLGWMKYKDIPINAVGGIINPINGKSIPIIHQYDRFPQLEDLVERQTSNKY